MAAVGYQRSVPPPAATSARARQLVGLQVQYSESAVLLHLASCSDCAKEPPLVRPAGKSVRVNPAAAYHSGHARVPGTFCSCSAARSSRGRGR